MAKVRTSTHYTINTGTEKEPSYKSINESAYKKLVEEATNDKTGATAQPEVIRQQTFTIHEAETLADIPELAPNEAVAVDLWNRGASLKQLTEIRTLMESDDFQETEGAYDLKSVINEATERRKMSPLDKVLKQLSGLSEEERQSVVAKLLGAQAATA